MCSGTYSSLTHDPWTLRHVGEGKECGCWGDCLSPRDAVGQNLAYSRCSVNPPQDGGEMYNWICSVEKSYNSVPTGGETSKGEWKKLTRWRKQKE